MSENQTPPFGGVTFYHLTTSPLERALPKLLEKVLAAGKRAVVLAESEARVEQLNQLLWTYDPGSFLPHGSAKDGNAEAQPIFLTTQPEAPNHANVLLITSGITVENPAPFERIADMFDGNDVQSLEAARLRWKAYKDNGHDVTYMRQTETGGWEKAA